MFTLLLKAKMVVLLFLITVGSVTAEESHPHHLLFPTPFYDVHEQEVRASPKINFSGERLEYNSSMFWNGMIDAEIRDTLAYCAMHNGLMILNVNDPTQPQLVSQLYLPEGWATDIRVRGNYAYLSEWGGVLYIINVSDPAAPFIAGRHETPSAAYGVDVSDTLVYVAYGVFNGDIGLLILNVSNPSNITVVKDVSAGFNGINGMLKVDVNGDYVYVVGDGHLWILDVSDPNLPVTETKYYTGFYPVDLFVKDTLCYLADLDAIFPATISSFTIINIADRKNPFPMGRFMLLGSIAGVTVYDDIAYVANGEFGLQLFDATNPSDPDSISVFETSGFVGKVAVNDTLAFVVDYPSEGSLKSSKSSPGPGDFQVVNVADSSNPTLVGIYNLPGSVTDVIISDHYIYTLINTGIDCDILIVGLSGMDSLGSYTTSGTAENAVIIDTLFLAAGSAGLEVIDISGPNPSFVRSYTTSSPALDVAVKDGYAYVAIGTAGFEIFDITKLDDSPITITTDDMAIELDLNGNYLYVADRYEQIKVYDVTEPENPIFVKSFGGNSLYNSIEISEGRLFSTTSSGFKMFSLIDPENPTLLGSYTDGVWNYNLFIIDNFVLLADGREGVKVINVSDSENMQQTYNYNTPGFSSGIVANEDYVIVADKHSLIILDNGIFTDVDDPDPHILPKTFTLNQNYPNPFNPATTIRYSIPFRSHVKLKVYNILGQEVITLLNDMKPVGTYTTHWNGKDSNGNKVASGIYLYMMTSGEFSESREMILLK